MVMNNVTRASQDRIIKITRGERPTGRRKPGRSMKRWIESWISTFTKTSC